MDAPGSYSLTAVYSGDSGDMGSTSAAVPFTLMKAPTTTVLQVSPTTLTPPEDGTLTATVTRNAGSGVPKGTVKLYAGGVSGIYLGEASLNGSGVASYTASSRGAPAGQYPLTAVYEGDGSDDTSTSAAVVVTIN
jgi:hypothetical protein